MRGRHFGVSSVFTAILTAVIVFMSSEMQAKACDVGTLISYINAVRSESGVNTLFVDESLTEAAAVRARECAVVYSHTRPDGTLWYTVNNASFGENLAKASNEEQAGNLNITAGWYLNPSHRQNLLEKRFTKVGVAYYEIDGITYIACEFGL